MKTIGIIGGMGPLATVDLMQKIILATDAHEDQEHIHILVDNNTNIPDRTAAILGSGPSPVPELLKSANRLTEQGAGFLIMGCNTAHFFLPPLMPFLKVPFLSMIEATAEACQQLGYRKVGLLASAGTCHTGIYQRALQHLGIETTKPDERQEIAIHDMIYSGVKAGNRDYDTTKVREVLKEMTTAGAEAFILGCTEIPLAIAMYHIEGTFLDATQVLAERAVAMAGAKVISHLPTPERMLSTKIST